MEDHGGHHPLLHGGHGHLQHPAALAYSTWDPPRATLVDGGHQLECFSTASELRQALLRALAELDAARAEHHAELRRVESEAARLAALVASAAAERDELRRHCQSLLLLHHHTQALPPPSSLSQSLHDPLLHAGVLGVIGGCAGSGTMDEHAPDADTPEEEAELEMALTRRLPEKGRLVEAVVSAGPLLQTLLLAGPLPRWRHPPPPSPADIPPFNPGRPNADAADYTAAGNSFSSASATSSSPESNCSGGGGGVGPAPVVAQQRALPCFHMSSFSM